MNHAQRRRILLVGTAVPVLALLLLLSVLATVQATAAHPAEQPVVAPKQGAPALPSSIFTDSLPYTDTVPISWCVPLWSATPSTYTVGLVGRVTDLGGVPVSGVRVSVHDFSDWTVLGEDTSDAAGEYAIGGLIPYDYHLRFVDITHARFMLEYWPDARTLEDAEWINLGRCGRIKRVDVQLEEGLHAQGRVADLRDRPLAGVTVGARRWNAATSHWQEAGSSVSRADGSMDIGQLSPGDYYFEFSHAPGGHMDQYSGGARTWERARSYTLDAGETLTGVDAILKLPSYIKGVVTSTTTSVAGTVIEVSRFSSEPPGWVHEYSQGVHNGAFTLTLRAGVYALVIRNEMHRFVTEYYRDHYRPGLSLRPVLSDHIVLGDEETVGGIEIRVDRAAAICGSLVPPAGSPVAPTTVTVWRRSDEGEWMPWASQVTGLPPETCPLPDPSECLPDWLANWYSFGDLPAGAYRVEFTPRSLYASEFYEEWPTLHGATTFVLEPGEVAPKIDVTLSARPPTPPLLNMTLLPAQAAGASAVFTSGERLEIQSPADVVTEVIELLVDSRKGGVPVGLAQRVGPLGFELIALHDGERMPNYRFSRPLRLELAYEPRSFGAIEPRTLVTLLRHDAAANIWTGDGVTWLQSDVQNRRIVVEVDRSGRYALANWQTLLYMPAAFGR